MKTDEEIQQEYVAYKDSYLRLSQTLKWWMDGAGSDIERAERALETLIKALHKAQQQLSDIEDITQQ